MGNGLAAHHLVAHEAQGSVGGDVAVDKLVDGPQVGDNDRWAPRGNIHPRTIGFGLGQGTDGRGGNLVGLEADQRAVDVEKQCVFLYHLAAKVQLFGHTHNKNKEKAL